MGTADISRVSTGEHGRGRRIGLRPTRAEYEMRLSQIHALLVGSATRRDICRFVSEKTTWGLTERSIERLIARATKMIHASAAIDRDLELGLAISQIKDIFSRSHRIQDYKTALAARKELSELLGLYAPKRVALTDTEGKTQQFIAMIPEPAKDNAAWSEQCKREREELARQRQGSGSTNSGGHSEATRL